MQQGLCNRIRCHTSHEMALQLAELGDLYRQRSQVADKFEFTALLIVVQTDPECMCQQQLK